MLENEFKHFGNPNYPNWSQSKMKISKVLRFFWGDDITLKIFKAHSSHMGKQIFINNTCYESLRIHCVGRNDDNVYVKKMLSWKLQ